MFTTAVSSHLTYTDLDTYMERVCTGDIPGRIAFQKSAPLRCRVLVDVRKMT